MQTMETLTKDEAIKHIIKRCRIMARLDQQDNGVPPPTDAEMEVALEDALNYINSYPPQSDLTVEKVVNDNSYKRYITLVCYGTLKYTFEMMIAYISANLMDVVIDDFPISSRLNEYQSLLQTYSGQLDQRLAAEKADMGVIIKGVERETSLGYMGWNKTSAVADLYIRSMKHVRGV